MQSAVHADSARPWRRTQAYAPWRWRCSWGRAGCPTRPARRAREVALAPCLFELPDRALAGVAARRPELFFDSQQLVVLGDAIRPAGGARLDLSRVGPNRE